ncbi:Secreted RxLR effector peptide protein [Phytophthora palmivora]|uniref:Secreted RxLR effector peptide protein n=1 Tax=Phytophthora palmivora TaxID=4796 RepID=A0A2P4YLD1_9STRA|nr:Secreted RxLR effector peptide protein [Phytophthora palmivora]
MLLARAILAMIFLLGVSAASIQIGPHQTNIAPSNLRTEPRSSLASATEPFSNRRLTLSDATHVANEAKDKEERGIPGTSMITEIWAFKVLANLNTNPMKLFTKLRFAKPGMKLDDNPVFIRWIQYVVKYSKGDKSYKLSEHELVQLLRQTQSDEQLVILFQKLRAVPDVEDFAGTLQGLLFRQSPSTVKSMSDGWLKHQETPQEVLKILSGSFYLEANNLALVSWLRYTELYRTKMGINSFSDLQTMDALMNLARYNLPRLNAEAQLGTLFQSIKGIPDLEKLAESMQAHLFFKWIHVEKANPERFGNLLVDQAIDRYGTWKSILAHPTNDAGFQTLKAYTLKYAEDIGDNDILKRVDKFFANSEPEAAVAAAIKASHT